MVRKKTKWVIKKSRILTRKEIGIVLTDLRKRGRRFVNPRQNLALFRLATSCGLRASEIAGLKMKHLHLQVERPYIRLPKDICKGGRSREVPVWWDAATTADLVAWYEERRRQGAKKKDPFLCMQARHLHGQPLTRFCVRDRFRSACKKLGEDRLDNLTVHDGRHSFVSHALKGPGKGRPGRSLQDVRDAVGHSNISITSIYAHIVEDDDAPTDLFAFNGD